MIRMRIGMMMMVMPVIMPVIMAMIVRVMVVMPVMMVMTLIEAAGPGAEMVTQVTILDIASRGRHALPLDMVVVALLCLANLVLEAENLRAVFAHRAVHVVAAFQNFAHPVGESGNHLWMVIQVPCLDELDIRMGRRHLVGEAVDAVDENAAEQEIGEHDDTLEAKPCYMLKTWLDQRKGHTGIADLGPAESHAFPKHAGNLRDI